MKSWLGVVSHLAKKFTRVMEYPTVTVEYPYVSKPLPKGARLQLTNNFDECTACRECEIKCPVRAIAIVSEEYSSQIKRPRNSKGDSVLGTISQFQIDYSLCVHCGICVEACAPKSLNFDKILGSPALQTLKLKEDLVHIPRSLRRDDQ